MPRSGWNRTRALRILAARVAEHDPDGCPGAGLLPQDTKDPGILSQEQSTVDKYADVPFGVVEEVAPQVRRHRPPVRLVNPEVGRDRVAMPPVGRSPGADPALNSLGVDVERLGKL